MNESIVTNNYSLNDSKWPLISPYSNQGGQIMPVILLPAPPPPIQNAIYTSGTHHLTLDKKPVLK